MLVKGGLAYYIGAGYYDYRLPMKHVRLYATFIF